MDIMFPRLGCAYLSIDAIDVSGEQQKDLEHNLFKKRFDENGRAIDTNITKGDLGDTSKEVSSTFPHSFCKLVQGPSYEAEVAKGMCQNLKCYLTSFDGLRGRGLGSIKSLKGHK